MLAFIPVSVFIGCASSAQDGSLCGNKISPSVASFFSDSLITSRLNVVVTVRDTAGLRKEFPSLEIANSKIALGQLTKDELSALCRRESIVYIETPKISFPNKRPE